VVLDSLQTGALSCTMVILDPDRSLWSRDVMGIPVVGDDSLLPDLVDRGASHFIVGLGTTGNNEPRRRLFLLGMSHGLKPLAVVHPRSICSPWATLGPGVQVLAGAIVNAGARIGTNAIVNTGAVIEHDCVIGDHVHVATGAVLAGSVQIGSAAHIGCGATVREGIRIGERAVVGAGAVVVKDVGTAQVVAGVPARPLRSKSMTSQRRED
jgi:sugar O-acyltransferase (sialic acid O-acetyltransferase NeuD family)